MGLMSDIKIKLGTEKDCVQPVSVEMSNLKVSEHVEKAFKKVQAKVKLPGFRPGKSPLDLIKQKYQDAAYAEAQESLLQEGVFEAIKEKKLNAVQPPAVTSVKFDPQKSFHFDFKVEVSPKFKLSGYKGIKITKTVTELLDSDVEKAMKGVAEANARLSESKAELLQKEHHATIEYEAFLGGKPIKGAKAENFLIDLSAPQNLEGLTEGLIGMKVGETKDIEVTFPADAPAKELAGNKAVFKAKIVAIKEKVVPVLDDEFAKDLGIESLEKLKEKVRENINKERDNATRRELSNQAIEKLLEENPFPVPATLVSKQAEYLKQRQLEQLGRQGISKEDQEKFLENSKIQIQQQAEKEIRVQYILNAIAETEKIEVSDEEISSKIKAMAAQYSSKNSEAFEKMIRDRYQDSIRSDTRDGKTLDWVISHAKVKEVSGGSK